MGLGATDKGGGKFEPDIGLHNVVCCGVIDTGTRQDQRYNKKKHDVIIRFEFPEIVLSGDDGDYNLTMGQFYNLSLNPRATLRKHLDGWRGKQFSKEELERFEMETIIGAPATLMIANRDNGKAYIESITKPQKKYLQTTDRLFFSFEDFKGEFPEWMSDNMKKFLMQADEYQEYLHLASGGPSAQAAEENPAEEDAVEFDDDIPF